MCTRYLAVTVMESTACHLPCSPVTLLVPTPARSLLHRRCNGIAKQQRFPLSRKTCRSAGASLRVRHVHSTPVRARWVADEGYKDEYCEPDRNVEYWNMRPIVVLQRTVEVGLRFARWLLTSRLAARQGNVDLQAIRAAQLREVLVDLGPAFVKIGQAVSARPDVTPPTYIRELEKLQDRIPPFPHADAMRTLAEELGAPADSLFSEMSQSPIAAASLGQVYKARLRATGQQVAVKVQRPGVASAIGLDTYILRTAAGWFKRWRRLNSDLPALIDEWTASLFRELDYRNEAANGVRFKELYGGMDRVYVPEMLLNLTTRRVLVMEWVEGERLRSASAGAGAGVRGSAEDLALVDVGVRCSLEQMLECGFYHADPHPGNLLRTADGRLAFLDFGMMGSVDPTIRRGLIRATLHLTNREYAALADDLITLGFLPSDSNKAEIVPALTGVFQAALAGGVSNLSFGDLGSNLGATMYKYSFRVPPYYTLLVRSLSVLEGIALSSEPGYKVLRAAYPWVARRLLTDNSAELRETLLALLYKDGRFQFSRCESLLREAIKSPARRNAGAASGRDGVPPPDGVVRSDALALLLSPEGAFIRDVVVEELSKGLDAAWRVTADRAVGAASENLAGLLQMREQLPLRGAVTEQVLLGVQRVPTLSDQEDVEQIEGLLRLARLLGTTAGLDEDVAAAPMKTLQSLSALLQWMANESQSLSQQQRNEALAVPLAIASKVSSRVVARGIRMLFASQPSDARPVEPERPVAKAVQAAAQRAALPPRAPVATPVPAVALPAPANGAVEEAVEAVASEEELPEQVLSAEVVIPDEVLPPPPATRMGAVAQ